MAQNQVVDTPPEEREKVVAPNSQPAKLGALASRGADSVGDRDLLSEVSHPVGFFLEKEVRMLAKTPGKNAGP